jgi:glycerophosphoryl diester phosphodiesterase
VARLPSLIDPPIAFAHRGGRAHAPENTLEAFRLALRLGATGLESDLRLTADGVPVLHHDARVRSGFRSRPLATLSREQLPNHIPSLADLYAELGHDYELSLDVKDPAAAAPGLEVAAAADDAAVARVWLCHGHLERLTEWRALSGDVRLVCSTRRRDMRDGAERLAAELSSRGIDALNLRYDEWTGGLTTLLHRFERYAFGWDAQHERIVRALVEMGIDGIYSDHVDRMVQAL